MVGTLILGAVLIGPKSTPLKLISASLFKNGYAVIVREATLGSNGEYLIEKLPQAALGTLWITGSKGVKLKEVVGTTTEMKSQVPASTLDEVIAANVGKSVIINCAGDKTWAGKVLSANGQIIVLGMETGTVAIPKSSLLNIRGTPDLSWNTTATTMTKAYRIKADSPADGKLYVLSLERGLTWVPSYAVDISSPDKLNLTGKAAIVNDLADIDGVDVKLITGFPNIPYIGLLDPFSMSQTVDEFTQSMLAMGTPTNFRQSGMMMQQNVAGYNRMEDRFDQAFNVNPTMGSQSEDLFFYTLPKVTLKKGERGYFVVIAAESKYKHIYEWEVSDQVTDDQYRPQPPGQKDAPEEVWHSLRFQNTGNQPWTTAAAITVKDGEILGQDMLKYTGATCDATLKITKALDIIAETSEEEISRERKQLPWSGGTYTFEDVSLKGTLRLRNLKTEKVEVQITKDLTGQTTIFSIKPEVTNLAKGLRAINPRQRLKWTVNLAPGEKRELTYVYRVLLRQ